MGDRRRNRRHFLCGLPADPKTATRALALAGRLLDGGLDVNAPAFVEDAFQATPLWYAIARGENVPLTRFLLKRGSTPENALHKVLKKNSDRRHVQMLLRHGADPTLRSRDGKSPLDLVRNRRDQTLFALLSRGLQG